MFQLKWPRFVSLSAELIWLAANILETLKFSLVGNTWLVLLFMNSLYLSDFLTMVQEAYGGSRVQRSVGETWTISHFKWTTCIICCIFPNGEDAINFGCDSPKVQTPKQFHDTHQIIIHHIMVFCANRLTSGKSHIKAWEIYNLIIIPRSFQQSLS